jgi:hypothetical protein
MNASARGEVKAKPSRRAPAMRLNVHPHVLVLDGVHVRDGEGGPLGLHPLPTPSHAEVTEVARRTANRIDTLLVNSGRSLDPELQVPESADPLELDEPALSSCYAAAARGVGRTAQQPSPRHRWPRVRRLDLLVVRLGLSTHPLGRSPSRRDQRRQLRILPTTAPFSGSDGLCARCQPGPSTWTARGLGARLHCGIHREG